ncbi:hypothetical protein PHACT_07150 [Pseudohongiella acticola]|uniref:Glycosyltransferase 2-like domain-containing protein n=1 Tax=Pseudohongiella acticola TaxID=1524254 RepID=A0A1E8CKW1_9GAMM|nr:glycosyltransferase family 2 protein [Pseudohongiella acticola]OFE12942.1 hypothetical protein PHACT_07150 [Pseudohongiella acticola]
MTDQHGLPDILVLMPVYNGAAFLAEQLDSILGQSHRNFLLLARDDGSSDHSVQILQAYAGKFPDRISLIHDSLGNLGASASFGLLLQHALTLIDNRPASPPCYVALADQDDWWHADKLACCLQRMKQLEATSATIPALVHSDLRVVDKAGQLLAPSLAAYQMLRVQHTGFVAQLVSNTLTGCTALMNTALVRKALPIPAEAVMHDWWLSLVASAFGHRYFEPSALVDYRQHGGNTLGARAASRSGFRFRRLQTLLANNDTQDASELFRTLAVQAVCFDQRYGAEVGPTRRWALRRVAALKHASALVRRLSFRLLRRL